VTCMQGSSRQQQWEQLSFAVLLQCHAAVTAAYKQIRSPTSDIYVVHSPDS
jgi:hypothetical protein